MKLAYICGDPGVPVFGSKGCSIHVQEVLRALRAQGVTVELFAARLGGATPADLHDLTVHVLPIPAPVTGGAGAREAALMAANPVWAAQFDRAGSFDAVYERYSLWSWAPMEWARRKGVPGLLEVNAPLVEEQAAHRGLADEAGARSVARRVFRDATRLLAVSEEVAAYLARHPEAAGRIEVVPNGVNPGRFAPALTRRRQRRSLGTGGVVLGFVGTFKAWHGTHHLVEAFARLRSRRPGVRLVLVGDGPERAGLEAQVAALGIGADVVFTGAVAAEAVPEWLGAMDIAVAPYPALEGFYFSPLKVYEYMAAGLPVVASRIGQIERVLDHGANGLLVDAGGSAALSATLERLVDDAALRDRLGWAARATVEHRHTWSAVAARILALASSFEMETCAPGGVVGRPPLVEELA